MRLLDLEVVDGLPPVERLQPDDGQRAARRVEERVVGGQRVGAQPAARAGPKEVAGRGKERVAARVRRADGDRHERHVRCHEGGQDPLRHDLARALVAGEHLVAHRELLDGALAVGRADERAGGEAAIGAGRADRADAGDAGGRTGAAVVARCWSVGGDRRQDRALHSATVSSENSRVAMMMRHL